MPADILDGLPEEKLLSTKQENALAKRGTPAAHKKLVLHNMREAVKYTKRVCNGQIPDAELLSLCYVAMMNAARRFKPNWARFFAFSKAHLRGAVKEHFNSLKVVKQGFVISREELHSTICRRDADDGDEHRDVEAVTGEIADPDFKSIKLREQWAVVEPLLHCLSERETMIINLHYKSGFALADIGAKLGVTCEAVRHTLSNALRKIRNKLLARKQLYTDY